MDEVERAVGTMMQATAQLEAMKIAADRARPAHGLWLEIRGDRLRKAIEDRIEREAASYTRIVDALTRRGPLHVVGSESDDDGPHVGPDPNSETHLALRLVCECLNSEATYILNVHELTHLAAGMRLYGMQVQAR